MQGTDSPVCAPRKVIWVTALCSVYSRRSFTVRPCPSHLRVGGPWLEEAILPQVSHLGAREFSDRKRGLEDLSGRGEGSVLLFGRRLQGIKMSRKGRPFCICLPAGSCPTWPFVPVTQVRGAFSSA